MKILKIFGIVVGIHIVALILIFANPGCSSSTKSRPSPADTAFAAEPAPAVVVPSQATVNYTPAAEAPFMGGDNGSPVSAAPLRFDPDAPATAGGVRYSPTRPNTPAASTLQIQSVADVIPVSTYTVVKGDSLWAVAKSHQITVSELAAANNLPTSATLRLGQKLMIPGKTETGPVTAAAPVPVVPDAPKPPAEAVTHVVKAGETLGAIARKYQVTVGEIATANNITDPAKIRPGRELIIPGWKAPGSHPTVQAPGPKPADTLFKLPAPDQDLDAGLKQTGNVPVIKVEETDPFGRP
jgi:LysM repeat protein